MTQAYLDAVCNQGLTRGHIVDLRQRGACMADVAGVTVAQQTDLEHLSRLRQRDLGGFEVEGGAHDQSPDRLHRAGVLAVLAQPVSK